MPLTPEEEARYQELLAMGGGDGSAAPRAEPEDSGITAQDALGAVTTAGKFFPPTAPAFLLSGTLADPAGARGAAQGATAGFGDEIAGVVQAISQHPLGRKLPAFFIARKLADLTSGVPASQRAAAAEVDAEREARLGSDFGANYQAARDAERLANEAAKAEAPWTYGAGQVAGALPAAIATGGKSLPAMLASGTGIGALTGAGTSEAETGAELALDTAKGGAVGAASALGGAALGKALPVVGGALKRLGIDAGRRVLTQGTKQISQAKAVSPEAVERAIQEGAIRPLGTTTGAAERLGALRAEAGEAYAEIIKKLEAAGVRGPARDRLAQVLLKRAQYLAGREIGPRAGFFRSTGRKISGFPDEGGGGRLGLKQAEATKRSLQDLARAEYQNPAGSDLLGQAQVEAAATVRQAVEEAVEAQASRAPELARQFVPVKQRTGQLIEAGTAAERAANNLQNRAGIGLRDLLVGGALGRTAGEKLAVLPLSMLARAVGPSTVATGAYGAGGALQALAPGASPLARALLPLLLQKEEEVP